MLEAGNSPSAVLAAAGSLVVICRSTPIRSRSDAMAWAMSAGKAGVVGMTTGSLNPPAWPAAASSCRALPWS